MINFQDMTPDIYCDESRDFQLLCKIGDFTFNEVKYEADTITHILDTRQIKGSILPLLQTKLGFFSSSDMTDDELRMVLRVFPELIKLKGSDLALKYLLNACLKLYNISASFKIERVGQDTKIGSINLDKYSILVGINKVISISNIVQELIKYIMPPGYKMYIYFYTDIPLSSRHIYKDYIDLVLVSDNISSQVRRNVNIDNINFSQSYEDIILGAVDTLKIMSRYENIDLWNRTDNKFWGIYKSTKSYPRDGLKTGDMLINSNLQTINYYYNNKWNELKYYGLRNSIDAEEFTPINFGVFGIKNLYSKLYYRYDSATETWVKLNYKGSCETSAVANPSLNDFINTSQGPYFYQNGWKQLGSNLGVVSKYPDNPSSNDFIYLNEVRYFINIDDEYKDFTDSFYMLIYYTTNETTGGGGTLGSGVLGKFILGGK